MASLPSSSFFKRFKNNSPWFFVFKKKKENQKRLYLSEENVDRPSWFPGPIAVTCSFFQNRNIETDHFDNASYVYLLVFVAYRSVCRQNGRRLWDWSFLKTWIEKEYFLLRFPKGTPQINPRLNHPPKRRSYNRKLPSCCVSDSKVEMREHLTTWSIFRPFRAGKQGRNFMRGKEDAPEHGWTSAVVGFCIGSGFSRSPTYFK